MSKEVGQLRYTKTYLCMYVPIDVVFLILLFHVKIHGRLLTAQGQGCNCKLRAASNEQHGHENETLDPTLHAGIIVVASIGLTCQYVKFKSPDDRARLDKLIFRTRTTEQRCFLRRERHIRNKKKKRNQASLHIH